MRNRLFTAAFFGTSAVLASGCTQSPSELAADNGATIGRYCTDCHSVAEQSGGLSLEGRSLEHVADAPEVWEKVVRKLRAGMMPPHGQPRPDTAKLASLASWLEGELDRTTVRAVPSPGLHRLNRTEYGNAIRDLLALEVDATTLFPPDDSSRGFDNQAGSLALSPVLLEAYLSAAGKISRLAMGAPAGPTQTLYRVPEDTTQNYHVPGLPFGTRGGLVFDHEFPVDGEYLI